MSQSPPSQVEEQQQLAREIGEELTDAFAAYVQGDVSFEDLTFGVYDALSDLHVIASGEYELVEEGENGTAEQTEQDYESYDDEEATDQQEDLSQEPAS